MSDVASTSTPEPEFRERRSPATVQLPIQDISDEIGRKTLGQRRINMVWELTQAFMAASVVGTTLWVNGTIALTKDAAVVANQAASSALMQLNVMAALVTGFYFGRTNHERTGGVGGGSAHGGR